MNPSDQLLIPYHHSALWGYCLPDKTMVFPCEYEWAGRFFGDAAVVKKGGKYGTINRSGKVFIPFSYTSLERAQCDIYNWDDSLLYDLNDPMMEGSDGFTPDDGWMDEYAGVKFIFVNGKYICEDIAVSSVAYDALSDFWEGLIWACKEGKWGAMEPTGKQIIPFMYEDAEPFHDDYPEYAFVCSNGQLGVINRDNLQYWED